MNDAIGKAAVLLVEDDALIREALGEALAERGFGVVAVDDADAAMRTLTKDNKIGAVISDVKMPGSLDGVGLAGWMKEHAPGVPVVLISGFPFMTDLAAINPAIAIIVKKPYDPSEVVEWVESLVGTGSPPD